MAWTFAALALVLLVGLAIVFLPILRDKWATDANVSVQLSADARDVGIRQADQAAYIAYTSHKDTAGGILGGVSKILGSIF